MNIFILDKNPSLAAAYHCDKHVVKMILESAQIMSTVLHMKGLPAPYKPTHQHHPCVKWAAESDANYAWLFDLFEALCDEYQARYCKRHKCEQYTEPFLLYYSYLPHPTSFVQCMPDEYKQDDVVAAYRTYYMKDKAHFAKWKLGNVPEWFKESV